MQGMKWYALLKGLGYGVFLMMIVAIIYAAFISIKYWAGIGV